MLREIQVSLPPLIAELPVRVDGALAASMESALGEVARLDADYADELGALGALLIRTESVASSKIEHIEASVDDYARAMHGVKANPSATSMVAATDALGAVIDAVGRRGRIELTDITSAHQRLMSVDESPLERAHAGRVRDVQNWIGGSDYSPRGALFVPPPPETVAGYLQDVVSFANRDDLPVVAQAAIVHAQFESIHPFTDGNGRIGRILINSVLRRRGATSSVVVPMASALVAHRDRYFDLLGDYRDGRARPIQAAFAEATRIAAGESRRTARRLTEIPREWRAQIGRVRTGAATDLLLRHLLANPVVSSDEASAVVRSAPSNVYAALDRLAHAGVIRPLTQRTRNQIWGASAVLDELADLSARIAAAAR